MKLLTEPIRKKLIQNHEKQSLDLERSLSFKPVVKLFTPDAGATWLLTELDPESNVAFGLCDLGLGCPELGYVSLKELAAVRGHLGLPIERDLFFEASMSLADYHREADRSGRICA